MKKILIFFALFFVPFIAALDARDTESEEYIIQKDDTLWDISESELADPFLWPKLWNVNPGIENPDLIYPGARIIIPSREVLMGTPTPAVRPTPADKDAGKKRRPFTYKPKIKAEEEEKYIFIPREKAVRKYIIDKELYIWSGWIADTFPSVGKVVHAPLDSDISGRDDLVYLELDAGKPRGAVDISETAALSMPAGESAKEKYFVIRNIKLVRHPETNRKLGYQIRIVGTLEITGADKDMIKAHIIDSFEDIHTGDGLLPYREMMPPLVSSEERAPDMSGYVVESHLNNFVSGEGDIVFLDKGENDGIRVGDYFAIFADPPSERKLARIQVVSLQPTTSSAVVITMTDEVMIGAKWGNR